MAHLQRAFNKNINQLSNTCNKAMVVNHQWHAKMPPPLALPQDEWEQEWSPELQSPVSPLIKWPDNMEPDKCRVLNAKVIADQKPATANTPWAWERESDPWSAHRAWSFLTMDQANEA
jgi:hypothetical protein